MELLIAGLSHHTAPLALRERVAVTADASTSVLVRLRESLGCQESLVLSTCNRTEVYVRPGSSGAPRPEALLAAMRGYDDGSDVCEALRGHVYTRDGEAALGHLFRVAAGLESMVLGEHEILRQVSDAYDAARAAGSAGPVLHRCIPRALQVGKRVRSETDIARGVTSVAGAMVDLASRVFRDLSQASIVTIGAGRTVRTSLLALRSRSRGPLTVLNRSPAAAQELAAEFGGVAGTLDDAHSAAGSADVVITATGAAEPLLRCAELAPFVRARRGRPLLVIDLGVPRDVEPSVAKLDEVYVYDVDHLQSAAERGRRERELELPRAEEIVLAALTQFRVRRDRLDADPSIRAVLDALLTLRRDVVDGERGLTDAERSAADRVTGKLVDRLLRRFAPRLARRDDAAAALLETFGIAPPERPDDPDRPK